MATLGKRSLGAGLEVSAIGLGCYAMTDVYGAADKTESLATIHRALDLGIDFLDTAEVYGPFTNEELVGEAIKGRRDGLVLATKFGWKIEGGKSLGVDSHPDRIRAVCDASLKRLGVDVIDLFYQHRIDPAVPIEDVAGTVGDLVKAGKVRFFGLSEAGAENIRRAHAVHPVAALQSEYSLWERNLESEIIPLLWKLGVGLVPFSPLGRGFLTGDVRPAHDYPASDWRHTDPRFAGDNFAANMTAVGELKSIAARHGASPAQVALAWLLAQGPAIVPIPGTKRRTHLEDNIGAATVQLTDLDLSKLGEAFAPERIMGDRYTPEKAAHIDR